jgi:hypothetical protein
LGGSSSSPYTYARSSSSLIRAKFADVAALDLLDVEALELPAQLFCPVGRFTVTRGEFEAFVTATGHKTEGECWAHPDMEADRNWRSPGFAQTDRHPAVCVNWDDAKAYVAWVASATGKSYRNDEVLGGLVRMAGWSRSKSGRADQTVKITVPNN